MFASGVAAPTAAATVALHFTVVLHAHEMIETTPTDVELAIHSDRFQLVAPYQPAGDQPQAIEKLVAGFENGLAKQVLLGVTGSGKTYTMANVIQRVQKPTLVMAHNKTLAAQLYGEFKAFFPHNAVEYFVSYYDYYQPEAYVPSTDTFIEKDSAINDHIEQMRLAATKALLSRRDTISVRTRMVSPWNTGLGNFTSFIPRLPMVVPIVVSFTEIPIMTPSVNSELTSGLPHSVCAAK